MKKLEHPNLVKLFEVIDDDEAGRMFLVMEYVPVTFYQLKKKEVLIYIFSYFCL